MPGTMHFKNTNPKIDFDNSTFKVMKFLTDCKGDDKPRIVIASLLVSGEQLSIPSLRKFFCLTMELRLMRNITAFLFMQKRRKC